jgi:predicted dehydrogenase
MPGRNFRKTEALEKTIPRVGIGLLGYGWMGRAHSIAYNRLQDVDWPPAVLPRLVAICGRNEARVKAAARRLGYEGYYLDWEDLITDDQVQVIDNVTPPYLHAEASIAALKAGKHIICEKPLAPTAGEARLMLDASKAAGTIHMTGFNNRFVPALRLARDLIRSGALGNIHLFRARYLQEFRRDPSLPVYGNALESRGRGSLSVIGCHIIDMARFLVGEIATVSGRTLAHISRRPSATGSGLMVEVPEDDTFHFVAEFTNGVTGILDGSSIATGNKNSMTVEVNGERGSLRFNLERMNELEVYLIDRESPKTLGFADVLVTESDHPYIKHWWPKGHIIGWEATFVHELRYLLTCLAEGKPVSPDGATFEDGYMTALISEAVRQSSRESRRVDVGDLKQA